MTPKPLKKNSQPLPATQSPSISRQRRHSARASILIPTTPAAAWNYELALLRAKELETAREQEKQEPEDPPRKEKSDPGESESTRTEDEDGGDEWQETDTEDASRLADLESSQSAMDLLNQDLPPPMVDPQDLLMEEELNNASRDKRSRKNYDPTEKDW